MLFVFFFMLILFDGSSILLLGFRSRSSGSILVVIRVCDLEGSNEAGIAVLGHHLCSLLLGDNLVANKEWHLRDQGRQVHVHEVDGVAEDVRDAEPAQTVLSGDQLVVVEAHVKLDGGVLAKVKVAIGVGHDHQ